ncbi:cytochrome c1 [Novosphingobium sp. YJ-S2-02]|uniref:Cytochrome c1 n=1 Tax=Novosphingobium aureum TaxID=2792964 RepID=A0A931HA10_9SPHN|nr:cytochrome c1 [Novosphingobium aureum]MBH0111704.1 cytochrome c1 [Novosphingobium aureum]
MARILSILVGLFFTVALAWSFGVGFYTWATEPAQPTAEHEFHEHPKHVSFSSDGPFGTFDRQQLQRGFQVYQQVCAACHALKHVAFRDLEHIGYNEAEVKAIAAQFQIPKYDEMTGEVTTAEGTPTDYFPPVAYGGQGSPPDLSLITKARHDGGPYVYSLLTGYQDQPAELLEHFPDSKTPDGLYYNPYFANLNLAMPPPLMPDMVTYSDGTKATVDQMSKDVSAFLIWSAEPTLEKRRQTGWPILGFLLFATILGYMSYRNIWAGKKH